MSKLFDNFHRDLQRQFDSERLADRIEQRLCRDALSDDDVKLIQQLDMVFIATVSAEGQPTCSYKGGDPGFVQVVDRRRIALPHFDGNGMFLTAGNIRGRQQIALLFIDFSSPRRLRIHGRAELQPVSTVFSTAVDAQFAIVIDITEVFPNCSRYIHRYALVERSQYVPHEGRTAPTPAWKQSEWARDVLPASDPAKK